MKNNTKEQPSYYAILTANVRYSKVLSANEKIMFAEITALSQKTGRCYATNKYFADLYGVSQKSVSRWITNLKKEGFVNVYQIKEAYEKDGQIKYKQIRYVIANTTPPMDTDVHTPLDKNVHPPMDTDVPLITVQDINTTSKNKNTGDVLLKNSDNSNTENQTTLKEREINPNTPQDCSDFDIESGLLKEKQNIFPLSCVYKTINNLGDIKLELWKNGNVKYTESIPIGEIKEVFGCVDTAEKKKERNKGLLKTSLSWKKSLGKMLLMNMPKELRKTQKLISMSLEPLQEENHLLTMVENLHDNKLQESSYSMRLLINQSTILDGVVKIVASKTKVKVFLTLTELSQAQKEVSTLLEICEYFAQTATNAERTICQIGSNKEKEKEEQSSVKTSETRLKSTNASKYRDLYQNNIKLIVERFNELSNKSLNYETKEYQKLISKCLKEFSKKELEDGSAAEKIGKMMEMKLKHTKKDSPIFFQKQYFRISTLFAKANFDKYMLELEEMREEREVKFVKKEINTEKLAKVAFR